MPRPEQKAYGSWPSPVSAKLLAGASTSVGQPSYDDGSIYWIESRPMENGRNTVMEKNRHGVVREVLPKPLSVRSTVHEYGGKAYLVKRGILYFCLEDDQRIYQLDIHGDSVEPIPLTPEPAGPDTSLRFADLHFDSHRNRLVCVCEDHRATLEPENYIAAVVLPAETAVRAPAIEDIEKLVSGDDFYAYPRFSPDGRQLCWLSWNHPDMPWDNTLLWLADIDSTGKPANHRPIAGGNDTSIFQPQWSPGGDLYYVSDQNNWWNIYRYNRSGNATRVCAREAEFATPLWTLGMSTYGFLSPNLVFCCYTENGHWKLATIDIAGEEFTPVPSDFTHVSNIYCCDGKTYFAAGSPKRSPVIACYRAETAAIELIAGDVPPPVDSRYFSEPDYFRFPTTEGHSHLLYYPPTNPDYCAGEKERPPLVVLCHGGPTGMSAPELNFKIQFWTSRGFAVADINYRGSTGFGRKYRNSLHYQWGIADVEDAVNGAQFLVERGLADADKTLIRGGSAGGYTVLAALAFKDYFKAGACLYGIGDLETLARDTHKFESRYLNKLVGEYPMERAIYQQRSPINHAENISCPVIFFQGLEDKVVPPQQTVGMADALREKRLPVACLLFEGEAHGFRKAETIEKSLQAELYFYATLLDFPVPDDCPAIEIDNLENSA